MSRRSFVALIAIVAAGSTAGAGADAASRERPDGTRTCANRAEGPGASLDISGTDNVRVGPVVFFGIARPGELVRERGHDPSLKAGIAVHAGPPVLLRIPPRARGDVAFQYATGRDGSSPDVKRVKDGQALVRVTPCSADTRRFSDGRRLGPWTLFTGGFVVRRAGCYPVQVARRGKPFRRVWLGIGTACAQKS